MSEFGETTQKELGQYSRSKLPTQYDRAFTPYDFLSGLPTLRRIHEGLSTNSTVIDPEETKKLQLALGVAKWNLLVMSSGEETDAGGLRETAMFEAAEDLNSAGLTPSRNAKETLQRILGFNIRVGTLPHFTTWLLHRYYDNPQDIPFETFEAVCTIFDIAKSLKRKINGWESYFTSQELKADAERLLVMVRDSSFDQISHLQALLSDPQSETSKLATEYKQSTVQKS